MCIKVEGRSVSNGMFVLFSKSITSSNTLVFSFDNHYYVPVVALFCCSWSFLVLFALLPLLIWICYNWAKGHSKITSLPPQDSDEVCVHFALPKSHLWDSIGYVIISKWWDYYLVQKMVYPCLSYRSIRPVSAQ